MKQKFALLACFFAIVQITYSQQSFTLRKPLSSQDLQKLQELVKQNPSLFSGTVQVNENGKIRNVSVGVAPIKNIAKENSGKSEEGKPIEPEKPDSPDPKPDPKMNVQGLQGKNNTVILLQNTDQQVKNQLNRILSAYE